MSGTFSFGAVGGAPSSGGGLFGGTVTPQQPQQQQQQQQQQQTAPQPQAPATTGGAPTSSFSFGGLSGTGTAAASAPPPAPAPGPAPATGGASNALVLAAGGTAPTTQQPNPPTPAAKVDLRALFGKDVLANPVLCSDVEISEKLDQLLDPGRTSEEAQKDLIALLGSAAFRERVGQSLTQEPTQRFYRPADEQTGQAFRAFAQGNGSVAVLHGWSEEKTAAQLAGKEDLVKGVQSLSRFLRLEETRTLQVLFLYLKDQARRGQSAELDSREYGSTGLHDRVCRFYHNERVFFLKNLQEFLRIDLDESYFNPDLRHAVQALLDTLAQGGASLADRLQDNFQALYTELPPRIQELTPARGGPQSRRRSAEWWERQRQEWVEQNVVEQGEVLHLLLLALAQRVSLGFHAWCQLLARWQDLRMGQLPPEKAYLAAQDPALLRRARRVSALMALVAIQGLQLGLLALPAAVGGIGGSDHPFASDLVQMEGTKRDLDRLRQLRHLFECMKRPELAEKELAAPELVTVILLFFTCFLHLSGPDLRPHLRPELQNVWDGAGELQAHVTQRAAQAHLAEVVATLLLDDEEDSAAATPTAEGRTVDQWARLGLHTVLRREADRLRPGVPRPVVEAVQVPLSEAVNALLAACYAGLPQGPPPLHRDSMTTKKLEFLVFLVASIYHGHSALAHCFWEGSGLLARFQVEPGVEGGDAMTVVAAETAGHPLEYLATEALERHPLLYFHLVGAMACDSTTATWTVLSLSRAPLSTLYYDERVLEHLGGHIYEVVQPFFDRETGVSVPIGTRGELVQAAPGRVPRLMRWDLSVWAALVHQLEDFAGFVARCHLLPMVDTLEALRRKSGARDGLQELGFNTVVDRCPSLFVYGPCPPRTEELIRELACRGAWGVVRYSLRRVEMVLDQLSVLVTLEQHQQRGRKGGKDEATAFSLLDILIDSEGVAAAGGGMPPLAQLLPARLFDLVRVASEAISSRMERNEAEPLVDLQAAALSLLGRLLQTDSPLPWRAEAVQALVAETADSVGGERLPIIVWLGMRSMEAERALGQYRITRDAVLLMHSLVESACDASWQGKEMVLPPGLSDGFVTRLVDFAVQVLLSLNGWTFAKGLDRWLLALACFEFLAAYTSRPFAASLSAAGDDMEGPGVTQDLEAHRQALLERFRHDVALLRVLLRCAEYLPASALHDTLKSRGRPGGSFTFLDTLHSPDREDEGPGLFLARDGILPLVFEQQGLGSTASREEVEVLERLGLAALKTLSFVLKHFLASSSVASPGALEVLMRGADVTFPAPQARHLHPLSQTGGRRPLVTHVVLVASLATYGDGAGGGASVSLAVAAVDVLGLLVRYLQRVRRLRQKELVGALPDWPRHMLYPFPPGVMEDILSVTDARGFRKGLFDALARSSTPGRSVVSMLDLLVNVVRLQPSLAKHLVFFRPVAHADATGSEKEAKLEEMVLAVLQRGQSMVKAESNARAKERLREGGSGMLVLASALRFLCVALRRATVPRRMEMLVNLDAKVWEVLTWCVQYVTLEEALEVKVADVIPYCHRLSVHRYLLEILTLLTTVCADGEPKNQEGVPSPQRARALTKLQTVVPSLANALFGRPDLQALLLCYLTASFRPRFVEEWGRKAAGPHGEVRLSQFRLPDWNVMLTDSNPRRFGSGGFLFDLPALERHLHATQVGMQLSDTKRAEVERSVRLLNQYYSISAAQHMLNKAFKGLLMVLIGRVRGDPWKGSNVRVDRLASATLSLLVQEDRGMPGESAGDSAFGGPGDVGPSSGNSMGGTQGEDTRRLVADGVDVARKMRQPRLELLLTIVYEYSEGLPVDQGQETLQAVQRAFEQLKVEEASLASGGVVVDSGSSSELLQLDLQQCLLTTALLTLRSRSLAEATSQGQLPELEGVLHYTIGSLASLEALLIEGTQEPAAPTCKSEKLEAVLRTAVALLNTLLASQLPSSSSSSFSSSFPPSSGEAQQKEAHDISEEALLQTFRQRRVLQALLGHWTAASSVAAAAFADLHDYTTVSGHAARSTEAFAALADRAVQLALKRLETLLRFFEAATCASNAFCQELLREGWVTVLMEDPMVACLARAVEGGAQLADMEQLLYRRGYRADGEESLYYALWVGLVRLMARVLHTLTRPHLGYEAVLALPPAERDPILAYANPLSPEETQVVREVAGFWRRLSPLLLWPLGADKVLTLGLLREVDGVLALAREVAVHGYTWRIAEAERAEELRVLLKGLAVRTSLVLGQAMADGADGTAVLAVLGKAFAPVSPAEVRKYRRWEDRRQREGTEAASSDDTGSSTHEKGGKGLELIVNEQLTTILASALAFLRYTGPLRVPKQIPLSPAEAKQVVLAEGTRVWYRDQGFELQEGVIQRRVREVHPQEAWRLNTYEIKRRRDHGLEKGVRPERVAVVEDREQDQAQEAEVDFDLPDPSSGVPSFNHGRLSAAHLLVLARYALDGLRRLDATVAQRQGAREKQKEEDKEREGHLTDLLIHALYLLLMAARAYVRSRGNTIQNKERVLPRFMVALAGVLWDACEWRAGRPRPLDDASGGHTHHHHHHHHHHHQFDHDMMMASSSESHEQRLASVRQRMEEMVHKVRSRQEVDPAQLSAVLGDCYRVKNLPPGSPAWLLAELRGHGHSVNLTAYAAALRACSQDPKLVRVGELLDNWVDDGLPTLLQFLDRQGGGREPGGREMGVRQLLLEAE